jgi:hypothetical protein
MVLLCRLPSVVCLLANTEVRYLPTMLILLVLTVYCNVFILGEINIVVCLLANTEVRYLPTMLILLVLTVYCSVFILGEINIVVCLLANTERVHISLRSSLYFNTTSTGCATFNLNVLHVSFVFFSFLIWTCN